MKIVSTLGLALGWALSAAAHDYPMPSNWDKLQVTRPTSRVNSSISARSDDPNSGDTLLGINCRGSGRCVSCEIDMPFLQTITDQIGDDRAWKSGQLIACALCQHCSDCPDAYRNGLCVFAQNMKAGEEITGRKIKTLLKDLGEHGCKRCGSIPINPGNNIKDGELTVNFVFKGCGERIC